MYSEADLQAAVEAGAITPDAANALRNHVSMMRSSPLVDEEQFRLITGFNDIFVSIAAVILLVALAWLGHSIAGADVQNGPPSPVSGLLVAAAAWGLAEYFTRVRRMALPSILLLLAFTGGVALTQGLLLAHIFPDVSEQSGALMLSGVALITAGATWLHWRRFMVPITVAAGAASLAAVAMALVFAALPGIEDNIFWLVLLAGLAIFAFAMWWDISDRGRTTRRSDVAFWLHLTAAPMIAHSMFQLLGVFNDNMGAGTAVTVVLLYVAFGLVALAVDRRALLVSSLAYVLYALYALFQQAGAVELSAALTALVIGSALLLLSAFWHPVRQIIVRPLPETLQNRLPYLDRTPLTA